MANQRPQYGQGGGFQQYTPTIQGYPQQQPNQGMHILSNQDAYGVNQQVGDEEYNRLLKNYKLAHERIEETRLQMLEQEKQNAILRKHILLLEGGDSPNASVVGSHSSGGGGSTVDDFTIKNSSSGLERRINRWAADTLQAHARSAPAPPPGSDLGPHLALIPLAEALYSDLDNAQDSPFLTALAQAEFDYVGLGLVVQSLLRHVMSQMLSEGIVNELLVTNSDEANRELTKLHEQLFNREPLVASVWRRQTFSAAVESLDPAMSIALFAEHMPRLFSVINPNPHELHPSLQNILEASYTFSRMLHASKSPTGGGGMESSGFYRAYVPDLGSQLDPTKLELIKKCYRTERGEPERVGACLFPGLVKVSAIDTAPAPAQSLRLGGQNVKPVTKRDTRVLVVRRAQVICECALAAAPGLTAPGQAPAQQ
ncbi:hypothetical protein MNV49_006369 [Pseudohyphozyma bogoriensis]|nr:hypothetical protein MNV49_006369 [Pseudohyphozyma bogoriensis]